MRNAWALGAALLLAVVCHTFGDGFQPPDSTPVNLKVTVEKNHVATWTFKTPKGTKGVLSGRWRCAGKSADIKGAHDDTLIAFKIEGPNNETLQKDDNHPIGGNFKIHCEPDGIYTFSFDNSGIIRSSSRIVTVEASYQSE